MNRPSTSSTVSSDSAHRFRPHKNVGGESDGRLGSRRRSQPPTNRRSGAYPSLSHISPFAFFSSALSDLNPPRHRTPSSPVPIPTPVSMPMPYPPTPSTPQSASATLVSVGTTGRNSFTTNNSSFEGRRPVRLAKESQFCYKRGRKHHSYGSEKAPYPVSYDRDVIDVLRPSLLSLPLLLLTLTLTLTLPVYAYGLRYAVCGIQGRARYLYENHAPGFAHMDGYQG